MSARLTNPQSERLKGFRRNLRKHATKSERILWQYLKANQLGVKFRRQVSVGQYIVDFYYHEKKLVIELDVYTHSNEETKIKDAANKLFWKKKGILCLDFQMIK
jgi:very-short-patch-repair endonuclease